MEDQEKLDQQASEDPQRPEEDDAEGHIFLPHDSGTAHNLAKGRNADIEREVKDRQRQKEARPNRR